MGIETVILNKDGRKKKSNRSLTIRIGLALSILALFIVYSGIADAAAPSTWSKTYGGSGADRGNAVVSLSDGYAVLGFSDTYSDADPPIAEICLVKTDLNGNRIWYRTYGKSADYNYGYAMIKDGDSFIIAGSEGNIFHLLKVYLNGTLDWDKKYGGSGYQPRSVARVGGSYVVAGNDINNVSLFLARIKPNGDLVWIKSYGESGHTTSGSCVIGVTDNGTNSYLVAGSYWDPAEMDEDIYLLHVKENKDVIAKRNINTDEKYEQGVSAIAAGSSYYIIGTSAYHGNASYSAYVLRVDGDLNKIWGYTYGAVLRDDCSIIKVDDGIVIAGSSESSGNKPYLARISSNGNLIREYVKNEAGEHSMRSLILAGDGDYVIAGNARESHDSDEDMYLAKVDSSVLDPMPTPAPSPSSGATISPSASNSPSVAPTEEPGTGPEPTDEPGVEPTSNPVMEPTSGPTAGAEASATPAPGTGETVTPAASPASPGDFSTSSVIIIVLLTVIATALVGIGVWLFTQKKK